jgi:hypothetical protein
MQMKRIQVETRADEGGDELPCRLCLAGDWIEVGEVLDRWYQGPGNPEWPESHYFKIIGYNFLEYLLKHDLEAGCWYLVQQQ